GHGAGAVVKGGGQPVCQHAPSAGVLVVIPSFLSAPGAGEVADAAGAVGAHRASLVQSRQKPVGAASGAGSVGLAGLGVAAGADRTLGPVPDSDHEPWPAAAGG